MVTIRSILPALDCPDPLALAAFYADLLGYEVEPLGDVPPENVTWIEVQRDGVSVLGLQKIDNYQTPTWPEGPIPQQAHLDFHVDDLAEAEAHALKVGARLCEFQPGRDFRVFVDPAGHPFCFVLANQGA
jgi:catechol 2,3-dioxygenase-like lactoylglutathione lyase family enzyme